MKEYYDKPQKFLTKKAFFKLPVTQRLKTGPYNLQLWLDIADHLYFDKTQKCPQGTSRAVMHNWLFNKGNNIDRNDTTLVDVTRNDHNLLDDTHRRAIHGTAEDNSVEDNMRRMEKRRKN